MSEIPFVNLLGDELDGAIQRARPQPFQSLRRRRLVVFGVAGALLVTATAAATELFSSADETRAMTPVSCYTTPVGSAPAIADASPETNEIATLSPVELCRQNLARTAAAIPAQLVACSGPANVAVIPGSSAADCRARGFGALTASYARAQDRTVRLERQILSIEASADCIAPVTLAERVQAALNRSGWQGWIARVMRRGLGDRPCATVSGLGGGGQRTFSGAYDPARHEVFVTPTASRHLTDLLFSKTGLAGPLLTSTGARCYTVEDLRKHVNAVLESKGINATLETKPYTFPAGSTLSDEDGRMTRYQQGCAIAVDVVPGGDDHSVIVRAWIKP